MKTSMLSAWKGFYRSQEGSLDSVFPCARARGLPQSLPTGHQSQDENLVFKQQGRCSPHLLGLAGTYKQGISAENLVLHGVKHRLVEVLLPRWSACYFEKHQSSSRHRKKPGLGVQVLGSNPSAPTCCLCNTE